jgi:hypothetical protein
LPGRKILRPVLTSLTLSYLLKRRNLKKALEKNAKKNKKGKYADSSDSDSSDSNSE